MAIRNKKTGQYIRIDYRKSFIDEDGTFIHFCIYPSIQDRWKELTVNTEVKIFISKLNKYIEELVKKGTPQEDLQKLYEAKEFILNNLFIYRATEKPRIESLYGVYDTIKQLGFDAKWILDPYYAPTCIGSRISENVIPDVCVSRMYEMLKQHYGENEWEDC